MLTLFALPKPFAGHTGIIQENAFESWSLLPERIQVIILGDETGVTDAAHRFGFEQIPEIARNEFGTPLVSDLFARARAQARFPHLCYINSDIILVDGFLDAASAVVKASRRFLMIGQRWNLDIREPLDFTGSHWRTQLRVRAACEGILHPQSGIDYFFFSKDLYANMPPLILGRIAWDNWLVWEARRSGAVVVDATDVVFAVHQEHDYAHVQGGKAAAWNGPEAQRNRVLTGMTTGSEGYIQNAAQWRFQSGRIVPAVKAIKFDPKQAAVAAWQSALEEATRLIEGGKYKQALERLEPLALYSEALSGFNFTYAVTFYHLGRLEEAAKACQAELRVNATHEPAKNLLAIIAATSFVVKKSGNGNGKRTSTVPVKDDFVAKVTSANTTPIISPGTISQPGEKPVRDDQTTAAKPASNGNENPDAKRDSTHPRIGRQVVPGSLKLGLELLKENPQAGLELIREVVALQYEALRQ